MLLLMQMSNVDSDGNPDNNVDADVVVVGIDVELYVDVCAYTTAKVCVIKVVLM